MCNEELLKKMDEELKRENSLLLNKKISRESYREKRKNIIKKYRKQMGIEVKIVEYAKYYYMTPSNKNFKEVNFFIECYEKEMKDFLNGNYVKFFEEYEECDRLCGFNEITPEPLVAFCRYCFQEYTMADLFLTSLQFYEEDLKHFYETKWDKEQEKNMVESTYRMKNMTKFFKYLKKIFKTIITHICKCTANEFDEIYKEYKDVKYQFIIDMDIHVITDDAQYRLESDFNDVPFDKMKWLRSTSRFNPINKIEKKQINFILYKIKNIQKEVNKIINQYVNKNNKKYVKQDIIDIANEYILTVKTNKGHDKLCNNIFDLMIRIMDVGDVYVNENLTYLSDMYMKTRNNRRIKKQGSVGSLDMYNSRLGIEKTPQELHKLLF